MTDWVEEVPQHLSELSDTIATLERRLLLLITDRTRGVISLADFTSGLALMLPDLESCYRRLRGMAELRNLGFKTIRMLQELEEACVWLYKKIRLEQTFFQRLNLDATLRSLVSPEAFDLYQDILDIAEWERVFLRQSDAEIRQLLLGETGIPLPAVLQTESHHDPSSG